MAEADQATTTPGTQPATTPAGGAETTPGPVPYDRFREVNERAKTLEARLAELENASKAAKERELSEQARWQELAQKREEELRSERQSRLRIETAAKKGLPVELAGRLNGNTAEEMAADADALMALMKPKGGPGVPPGGNGAAPELKLDGMTPEEIRQNAAKLLRGR